MGEELKIKAVIFDYDGTLAPLNLDFASLRQEILKIAFKYVPISILYSVDGLHILELVYEIESLLGEKGGKFRTEAFSKLKELEVEAALKKSVFPYTRYVLKALKERGVKRGIMTRTCVEAVSTSFFDYSDYVEVIVTRDDVERVKPHPDHVRKVLEKLKTIPQESMIVGDHPTDIMAGTSLRMRTVGVLTGRTGTDEFVKVGATYIFQDIREILNLI